MSNIKKVLIALLLLWVPAASIGALSSDNPPLSLFSTGSSVAAGTTCTLSVPACDGYVVILDGTSVATSTITVAVSVLDTATNTYVTPTTLGGVSQPVTLTNATIQTITIPGGYPGIQVNVTSFGTATGTFYSTIQAY